MSMHLNSIGRHNAPCCKRNMSQQHDKPVLSMQAAVCDSADATASSMHATALSGNQVPWLITCCTEL